MIIVNLTKLQLRTREKNKIKYGMKGKEALSDVIKIKQKK